MGPTPSRQHLFLLLITLGAGFLDTPPTDAACQTEEVVKVTVVVVLATDQCNKIDPLLKCLAEEVRKKRPNLTGFQQGPQICKSLTVGKEDTFELLEDQSALVTVKHGANAKNWVCLKVKTPGVGDITYASLCGKFFPVVTEYKTKKQETLILAIRVEPCKGKK